MKITISAVLFSQILELIHRDRPETFSAHTTGIRDSIDPPYNFPKAGSPNESIVTGVKIDYYFLLTGIGSEIDDASLKVSGPADLFAQRTNRDNETISAEFKSDIQVFFRFSEPRQGSNIYHLITHRAEIDAIQPPDLMHTVSWFITNSVNDSFIDPDKPSKDSVGIPKTIGSPGSPVIIDLEKPIFNNNNLEIRGVIR